MSAAFERITIVGGSIAGLSAARELRSSGFTGAIQMVDGDPHAQYRRPEVSKGILTSLPDPKPASIVWPDELGIERVIGVARELHPDTRLLRVDAGDGVELSYDGLILATGSRAREIEGIPPSSRIFYLRTMQDALDFRRRFHDSTTIAVIGGGMIGLEVASAALGSGKQAVVIERGRLPLERAIGVHLAERLLAHHRESGIRVLTEEAVTEVVENGQVELALESGGAVSADALVVAIGAEPTVGWLETSGLSMTMGIDGDEHTSVIENVVAAGDAASWIDLRSGVRMRIEHWAHAVEHGGYAARRLLGLHSPEGFSPIPYFWSNQGKFKVERLGLLGARDEQIVTVDTGSHSEVAFGREGRLVAVAGINAPRGFLSARAAILGDISLHEFARERRLTAADGVS